MAVDIESTVHHQFVAPLLATGRMPATREVADKLALPKEEIEHALYSLAKTHGVVLHPHVCEPWVIAPFSASPTATWVEAGDRGWWASCMWCACGVATLAGGDATIHARLGGEREDHLQRVPSAPRPINVYYCQHPNASVAPQGLPRRQFRDWNHRRVPA
jgi:hypothetical protein